MVSLPEALYIPNERFDGAWSSNYRKAFLSHRVYANKLQTVAIHPQTQHNPTYANHQIQPDFCHR